MCIRDRVMLTPNGRFEVNKKLCMSFTNYHPESWNSSWNIQTMLMGLVSLMHTDEKLLGGIDSSADVKRSYAKKSLAFNLKNPDFKTIFEEHFPKLGIDLNGPDEATEEVSLQVPDPIMLDAEQRQRRKRACVIFVACLALTAVIASTVILANAQLIYMHTYICLLYTSPSPRDGLLSRMPSSA
eukprot:TRINITY_DN2584_c0_g1_i2.p1 TRINITY_DN2584_c0_g1~~TRINITY_DN2584_c0_g1_i2.p1  ORF type:complete len:184 (+),score=22.04 TRINITY_DN2584_c0_g1_i2:61-612(+)